MRFLRDRRFMRVILVVLLGLLACAAFAQNPISIPKVSLDMGQGKGGSDVSSSLQILALLTVLSLAPAILILTTAFTRIVIIMSFVRNAIATPTKPPNQVLICLRLLLTV